MKSHQPLIFIGDIHGQYQALIKLLDKLGFQQDRTGWRHPQATAVFLGDLIDRGIRSREVVETVRNMVEHGYAHCIMGNHELNAIHYHTPDGNGGFLRAHTDKNHHQHKETLDSYATDASGLSDALAWFSTLPVALDLESVRAVHATWSAPHLNEFEQREAHYVFRDTQSLNRAAIENSPEYEAVEILLKAAEIRLPDGVRFLDKSGNQWRNKARLNWWRQDHPTWEKAISVPNEPKGLDMQARPDIPEDFKSLLYPENAPPVFFGHYWLSGDIGLQAHNAFCADYSAGKGDKLCAYIWRNEQQLSVKNAICVSVD